MLAEIPHRQFLEWVAYAKLEPFGEERADLRSAIIAATVYNMQRGRRASPRRVEDFMPFAERKPRNRMTPAKVSLLKSFLGVPHGKADEPHGRDDRRQHEADSGSA